MTEYGWKFMMWKLAACESWGVVSDLAIPCPWTWTLQVAQRHFRGENILAPLFPPITKSKYQINTNVGFVYNTHFLLQLSLPQILLTTTLFKNKSDAINLPLCVNSMKGFYFINLMWTILPYIITKGLFHNSNMWL